MIYMPPRPSSEHEGVRLAEVKEALDRTLGRTARSRESPRVAIPRSPCTSLYGSHRPTTGVSPWISASGRTIAPRRSGSPPGGADSKKEPAVRGRPSTLSKLAVREDRVGEFVARAAKVLLLAGGRMDSNLFGQQWKLVNRATPLASFKTHKGVAVHQMMTEHDKYFDIGTTDRSKVKIFEVRSAAVEAFLVETNTNLSLTSLDNEEELVRLRQGVPPTPDAPESEAEPPARAAPEELALRIDEDASMYVAQRRYSDVPMQGRARNSNGFDRRALPPRPAARQPEAASASADAAPAEPTAREGDACASECVKLYNGWALDGRDVVMEVSNAPPLEDTLRCAVEELCGERGALRAVDVGCGNGWAARLMRSLVPEGVAADVLGVDAASLMVRRARELDAGAGGTHEVGYEVGDAAAWAPAGGALDLVLAVELLHLVADPAAVAARMAGWLRAGGRLIVTLECYSENRLSMQWAANMGVPMTVQPEADWVALLEAAGFGRVVAKRAVPAGPWQGMLIIEATKL